MWMWYTWFLITCKGTYACLQLHRDQGGNIRNTVAHVASSDLRCRSVVRVSMRILRHTSSRDMVALTRPHDLLAMATLTSSTRPRHYIIPLFMRRPPGQHILIQRKQKMKQIAWEFCGSGAQRISIFICLWSGGGEVHVKAICTGPD